MAKVAHGRNVPVLFASDAISKECFLFGNSHIDLSFNNTTGREDTFMCRLTSRNSQKHFLCTKSKEK